jgi:hypothetical protein
MPASRWLPNKGLLNWVDEFEENLTEVLLENPPSITDSEVSSEIEEQVLGEQPSANSLRNYQSCPSGVLWFILKLRCH